MRALVTMSHSRRLLLGAGVVLVLVAVGGVLVGVLGGAPHRRSAAARPSAPTTHLHPTSSLSSAGTTWKPVPTATVVPADTPVQRRDDQVLAKGLRSSPSVSVAEAARVPDPAFSGAWPALPVSYEPEGWTKAFVGHLLDIDFASQSRAGLGAWLSAEEAPESLPGVPSSAQNKMLYLSLFDPAGLGGTSTPIPSARRWAALARAGVRWSVSDVLIQPDSQWAQLVASGWEPTDERLAAEDVSGVLRVSRGSSTIAHRFSMVIYVGSGHWHPGYGTVLVNDWKQG